jgi:hypothetical protein
MTTKFSLIIISVMFFVNLNIANAQTDDLHCQHIGRIGIPISQVKFNGMVGEANKAIKENDLNTKNIITIIRIINTIQFDHLTDQTNANKEFFRLFNEKKCGDVFVKKLGAKDNIGGSYYSKKYKIYWGGIPDDNSKFLITDTGQ